MFSKKIQKNEEKTETPAAERTPSVDVYESGEGYLLAVDLPGATDKDVELTLDQGQLTLEARVDHAWQGPVLYRRHFAIPLAIDRETVEASISQGTLTLKLPKSAAARETSIAVRAV